MEFQREHVLILIEEGRELMREHWDEITAYKDIPLGIDEEKYSKFEELGAMRAYSVREDDVLIGYAVFFVQYNPHYKGSLQATQDVVFIRKDKRGFGKEFLAWCDKQLEDEGVQVVYHHIKTKHNWGAMLEQMGYQLTELIYSRRLDK